jgi:flagellar motility protein MotE (MotC chaperone)
MKLLTSPWGIAFLALLLHVGTSLGLLLPAITALQDPVIEIPEKTELPARVWNFKTEAVDGLIGDLKTEREKLEAERKEFIALQSQVAADRAEVERVRADVAAMRAEIDSRIVEIEERELKNLKTLAQTYGAMAPGGAVAIFREMEENAVVKVLSLMKAAQVGPILAEMAKGPELPSGESSAKRAANISDKLRLLKPAKKEPAS